MTRIEAIMAIAEVMGRNGEALDPETTMSLDSILETAFQAGWFDGYEHGRPSLAHTSRRSRVDL